MYEWKVVYKRVVFVGDGVLIIWEIVMIKVDWMIWKLNWKVILFFLSLLVMKLINGGSYLKYVVFFVIEYNVFNCWVVVMNVFYEN